MLRRLCRLDKGWSVLWEEGTSIETVPLSDWSMDKSVGPFSWLMIDVKGPSPLLVVSLKGWFI